MSHRGDLTEPQRGPAAGASGSVTCGSCGCLLSPPAHPGQMAQGHWRGDDPHKFTNGDCCKGGANWSKPHPGVPSLRSHDSGTPQTPRHPSPGAAVPVPALRSTAATCQVTLSLRENQRGNDAYQPGKHHVSRNGRFPAPEELPVSISKVALKNTLKYSP